MPTPGMDAVPALSLLDDPVRRRLYEEVCARGRPVSRDEAATAAGVARTLAAYHLDKLAGADLLTVSFERRSGRAGPGAGRPAKLYARTEREVVATVPPRDYGLAARLLAAAADGDTSGRTVLALRNAADRLGRDLADETASGEARIEDRLRGRGYEPYDAGDGVLRLRNCPFHTAARAFPDVVCAMNLALLRGLLEGLDDQEVTAELEPAPGHCCVTIRPVTP
jgi:predicted ArsR family transcriptional regulator